MTPFYDRIKAVLKIFKGKEDGAQAITLPIRPGGAIVDKPLGAVPFSRKEEGKTAYPHPLPDATDLRLVYGKENYEEIVKRNGGEVQPEKKSTAKSYMEEMRADALKLIITGTAPSASQTSRPLPPLPVQKKQQPEKASQAVRPLPKLPIEKELETIINKNRKFVTDAQQRFPKGEKVHADSNGFVFYNPSTKAITLTNNEDKVIDRLRGMRKEHYLDTHHDIKKAVHSAEDRAATHRHERPLGHGHAGKVRAEQAKATTSAVEK